MAPATVSPRSEPRERDLALRWSGRVSLTRRILAVNIFALALLAGGFFYLDSYRTRILDSRVHQSIREVRLMAEAISAAPPAMRNAMTLRLARETRTRIRRYDRGGVLAADTRTMGLRNVVLIDPDKKAVFESLCARDDLTPSQVVRRLIREYIEGRTGRPWRPGEGPEHFIPPTDPAKRRA